MLLQIVVRGYAFRAAGDYGALAVYDHRGKVLTSGLRDAAAAETWCARWVGGQPEREPSPKPAAPQIGRSTVTGY